MQKVYTVLYQHRHGTDGPFLYTTREGAEFCAAKLILEWLDEVDEKEALKQILTALSEGRISDAISAWRSYQNGVEAFHDPEELEIGEGELEELSPEQLAEFRTWLVESARAELQAQDEDEEEEEEETEVVA